MSATTKASGVSSQTHTSSSATSSSVSTKPVHPVTLSSFAPTGCELSTWAYITTTRPPESQYMDIDSEYSNNSSMILPNLVVAHSTCLRIYVVDPKSGTLILASSYENLAGTIVSLDAVPFGTGNSSGDYDGILLGFAGHPRLSIVYPAVGDFDAYKDNGNRERPMRGWSGVLTASSIIDLTSVLTESSRGSVTPLDQDLNCSVAINRKVPTVSVILGGGVAVATFQLSRSVCSKVVDPHGKESWWRVATEPYFLPLSNLSTSLNSSQKSSAIGVSQSSKYGKYSNSNIISGKVSHGFGDIISSSFLNGYTEPVLTLLHSNPNRQGGRTCPGRLGHQQSSTRNPLTLTAVSVSIDQKRSVVLWSLRDAIPSDAFELYQHPQGGVLVVCVNEILYVNCSGEIECCTALNGWVRSTASANLRSKNNNIMGLIQPNPSPLRKLSIQLDGSRLVFVNKYVALVSLRNGSLYSLELHDKKRTKFINDNEGKTCLSLSPIGQKLGGVGMVSTLSCIPLPAHCHFKSFFGEESNLDNTKKEDFESEVKKDNTAPLSLGLIFAGSRIGDSTFVMYGLKNQVTLTPLKEAEAPDEIEKPKRKKENNDETDDDQSKKKFKLDSNDDIDKFATVSDDEENMPKEDLLTREEEGLYKDVASDDTIISLDTSSKKVGNLLHGINEKQLYRPQVFALSIFQHFKVLDSLTGLGPLAPGCEGPIACGKTSGETRRISGPPSSMGSIMNVHPCGFGSSGGLAILTAPGLNYGSTIISEADCRGIGSTYYCPVSKYVFLVKKGDGCGCMILQLAINSIDGKSLVEVNPEDLSSSENDMDSDVPTFFNTKDILTRMKVLSVAEFVVNRKAQIMVLAQHGSAYAITIHTQENDGKLSLIHTHMIGAFDESLSIERGNIVRIAISENIHKSNTERISLELSFACVWSSGHASMFLISPKEGNNLDFEVREAIIEGYNIKCGKVDEPIKCSKIVAIDTFSIADNIFEYDSISRDSCSRTKVQDKVIVDNGFDEDDNELYGGDFSKPDATQNENDTIESLDAAHTQLPPSRYNTLGGYVSGANLSNVYISVISICCQSGDLMLLDSSKLFSDSSSAVIQLSQEQLEKALLWSCQGGCGSGSHELSASRNITTEEEIYVSEMKFFFCGPSNENLSVNSHQNDLSILRSFCLLIETNTGDLHLYTGSKPKGINQLGFRRVPLRTITRRSKEENRHRNKLIRKGIVVDTDDVDDYRPSKFYRFFSLSGQDGLFSATTRPLWFVSERGAPTALSHRLRHSAPSGSSFLSVSGFCSGLQLNKENSSDIGFITVHERIGQVGSQRLTFFNGLSDVFTPFGLLPGGGHCIQKIPLGVTVRQVQYIKDPLLSSSSRPLYALLISREVESDQSYLNDDGLTTEERELIKKKREEEKMQRQVETDLGGFEVEQEWVEEIEREDCFVIEKRFGGAPPILSTSFEIWLVDASDWQMVDTYQLQDYEHGLAMKFMQLSDIPEDVDNTSDIIIESSSFLVVGTGIVDDDGEDVSSKGRVLLFELNRTDEDGNSGAQLNFLYDKEIPIGPVTSLNNLTCENKSRLVVGAGAEVTIEQWGNGKLLQVGFFHANMHVQDIILFKTFFLLSDAYDSLHFLVWRESDKSLTLLAKDYEPSCVYAAGIISRGGAVSFVSQDDRQNLRFFNYAPKDVAARGGNKLVCRADHHLGQQTIGFKSHFCRSSLTVNSATPQSTLVALKQQEPFYGKQDDDQRFGVHYGSTDGQIGCIVPVNEDIYWRLAALQSIMSNALLSDCSLNQRSWRLYRRTIRRGGCRSNVRMKGVIDCDLIIKYADLPMQDQEDLARAIGSTVDLIIDNLLEVTASSAIV